MHFAGTPHIGQSFFAPHPDPQTPCAQTKWELNHLGELASWAIRSSSSTPEKAMATDSHTIIYTHTDEAPALATKSLLPVVPTAW